MGETVAAYLVRRLSAAGVETRGHPPPPSVSAPRRPFCWFTAPCDNDAGHAAVTDAVHACADAELVIEVSEARAGFAADGFARLQGLGVLLLSSGAGELSAAAAIAGCFAEGVPLVVLSCSASTAEAPTTSASGRGCLDAARRMVQPITVATSTRTNVLAEVERLLHACTDASRPVHMTAPLDVLRSPVPSFLIASPPPRVVSAVDGAATLRAAASVACAAQAAARPVLLLGRGAGACVARPSFATLLLDLVEASNLPVCVAPAGRGAISECHPNFSGVFDGSASFPASAKALVETSDCVIAIGDGAPPLKASCVMHLPVASLASSRALLSALATALPRAPDPHPPSSYWTRNAGAATAPSFGRLWPGDVLVLDRGASSHVLAQASLPLGCALLHQPAFQCPGWAAAAASGAARALSATSPFARVVAVTDGPATPPPAQRNVTTLAAGERLGAQRLDGLRPRAARDEHDVRGAAKQHLDALVSPVALDARG